MRCLLSSRVASSVSGGRQEYRIRRREGIPKRHAARLATCKDFEAALREHRLSSVPLELLQCLAEDLIISNRHMQAVRSEHGELQEGPIAREWRVFF